MAQNIILVSEVSLLKCKLTVKVVPQKRYRSNFRYFEARKIRKGYVKCGNTKWHFKYGKHDLTWSDCSPLKVPASISASLFPSSLSSSSLDWAAKAPGWTVTILLWLRSTFTSLVRNLWIEGKCVRIAGGIVLFDYIMQTGFCSFFLSSSFLSITNDTLRWTLIFFAHQRVISFPTTKKSLKFLRKKFASVPAPASLDPSPPCKKNPLPYCSSFPKPLSKHATQALVT